MQDDRGRRVRMVAGAAMAALMVVAASGCGGGSSDGAERTTTTLQSTETQPRTDQDGKDVSDALPDPCDLVPIEKASEILGGEAAKPESSSSEAGTSTKSCTWQTQASVDNPTIDGAGHILTLQVVAPPATMSVDEFWKAAKSTSDPDAGIEGCDESFWLGGLLSALKDGVYLTGSAGLADDSPDAKASTTALVSTACGSIS